MLKSFGLLTIWVAVCIAFGLYFRDYIAYSFYISLASVILFFAISWIKSKL